MSAFSSMFSGCRWQPPRADGLPACWMGEQPPSHHLFLDFFCCIYNSGFFLLFHTPLGRQMKLPNSKRCLSIRFQIKVYSKDSSGRIFGRNKNFESLQGEILKKLMIFINENYEKFQFKLKPLDFFSSQLNFMISLLNILYFQLSLPLACCRELWLPGSCFSRSAWATNTNSNPNPDHNLLTSKSLNGLSRCRCLCICKSKREAIVVAAGHRPCL